MRRFSLSFTAPSAFLGGKGYSKLQRRQRHVLRIKRGGAAIIANLGLLLHLLLLPGLHRSRS